MRRLHVFPDSEDFGRQLSESSGIDAVPLDVHRFPDGESLVRIQPPSGEEALVVRSLHHPRGKLFETLLAADALRREGARSITLVTPYLPYMRQDRVFHPGESLSQSVMAHQISNAFDGLICVEAHTHRTPDLSRLFGCRVSSLSAAEAIAGWIRREPGSALLVGPDVESGQWVRPLARASGLPEVVGAKRRLGDDRVLLELPEFPAVERAIVVDDIASSGATLAQTARLLRARGVPRIDAVVVHPVFAESALELVREAGVQEIVSTDSIPHSTNAIALAPVVADALVKGAA